MKSIAAREIRPGLAVITGRTQRVVKCISVLNGQEGRQLILIAGPKTAAAIKVEFEDGKESLVHPAWPVQLSNLPVRPVAVDRNRI